MNILLGVTGSVAAIKTLKLHKELSKIGDVKIIATEKGKYFIEQAIRNTRTEMSDCVEGPTVISDADEWKNRFDLGDPVEHIELRRWASCFVIAPLDANTLAKLHHGLCDNALTCVYRAWDWTRQVFVAPAMNTYMWENEPTQTQIQALKGRGVHIIDPVEKVLACKDVGMGAMASIEDIAEIVKSKMRWHFPLKECSGIPINHHPGAFGFQRKKNHHTGVDLYCNNGSPVFAVEDGIVVHIEQFTGKAVGHNWWEDTIGVMVEGASGVVNYGEVTPFGVKVGQRIKRGQNIAHVKRVLFEDRLRTDIPGHSCSMLHFELYKHGTRDFADWHDVTKNPDLIDPTFNLINASGNHFKTLTWDNTEAKSVG